MYADSSIFHAFRGFSSLVQTVRGASTRLILGWLVFRALSVQGLARLLGTADCCDNTVPVVSTGVITAGAQWRTLLREMETPNRWPVPV